MNTEQLRHFALAYQMRNFAAAARTVPMSAQGFTKSLKNLEAELGVPLFVRDEKTGTHHPTPYADEFNTYVHLADAQFHELKRAFRRIEDAENERVVIGASLGIMGLLGQDFRDALARFNPNIKLACSEMSDYRCDESLANRDVGLAFTLTPYNSDFHTTTLYTSTVRLWVNTDDPLACRETITVSDLEGRKIALPGPEYKCNSTILGKCRELKVHLADIHESSEMFWLFNFAYEGCGVAFSVDHLGALPCFTGERVRCIPLEGITWRFGVSSSPKRPLAPSEAALRDFCIRYCAKRFGGQGAIPEPAASSGKGEKTTS